MKKPLITLLSAALLLANAGCKDILDEDPQSVLVPSFLGTPQGVEAGLTGAYSVLRNIYGNEEAMFMAITGTDEFMRGIATQAGLDEYNRGAGFLPTASPFTNQWNIIYRAINGANGVIKYAGSVQGVAPARVQQIVAEAKVLRAHYYFLLVQYFGDVPLSLEFTEAPTKDVVRAPKADVYAAIITDLNDALANISNGAAQSGRVTRATALHLLAKVHLTRATSTAKQADDYAKAAQFAKELIDDSNPNAAGAGTGVGAKYGKGLEATPAQVFAEGNENGKEVLFNVQHNGDATFSQTDPNNFAAGNVAGFLFRSRYDLVPNLIRVIKYGRPFARFCPTPYLFNTYILSDANGNPLETGRQLRTADARYRSWFTTVWTIDEAAARASGASPMIGNNGGNRAAIDGDTALWYPGRELTAAEQARIAARRPGVPYRVYTPSQYTTEYYPVMNKYDDSRRTGTNNPSLRPVIIYRLAETYLIAAEAYMYLGNTTLAATYLNVVRQRAAAAGRAADMTITPAQVTIDFILDERTRELAGEHMRWFDLVRTGKLVDRVKANVPPVTNRPNGTYGSAAAANIQPYHVLRPIPQQEIDRTSGKITQNNGY